MVLAQRASEEVEDSDGRGLLKKGNRIMDVSEDGTVTGSIDVNALDEIEPKTDEAKAQLDALKAQAQAGQEQADADAEKLAEQAYAQSPEGQAEAQDETTTEVPVEYVESDEDLDGLRAEAESLGVKVDGRWGADRLRQEIDAAKAG